MSYPPTMRIAGEGAGATLADVQRDVLTRSSAAIVNCYYGVEGVRHPFMAAALASAVNQWLREEWLDREPRLFASIVVPPHDTELAVEEIKRADHPRFVQVLLPARAWEPYGNRRYWPIYETAIARGLAVAIHFGGLAGNPPTPVGQLATYFEEYAAATQLFASHVLSLLAEGVFDRYPDLRIALVEGGVSWLPTWMWKLDTEWKATRREIPWVRTLPSSYIRRHMRMTTQPLDVPSGATEQLRDVLEQIGSDEMLMFSSDYPHAHGRDAEAIIAALPAELRAKVLAANASAFYRLKERARN
jgi:predicted TIM-barrel fold metal-dependent hydrolase